MSRTASALTQDQKIVRFDTPGNAHQPANAPLGATVQVMRGTLALLSGGTTVTKGYLANASSPASTDVCVGLIEFAGPGTADTGPGITGGSTDGAVTCEIATGSFLLASGSGADQLSVSTAGATVYVINETTVGATNGGGTRPAAGIQLPAGDLAFLPPGSTGLFPIKLNTVGSP